MWRLQLLTWLQLLRPLLRERVDRENVDHLLEPRLESDPDEFGTRRPVLLQQRQEQVELLEPELEDRLHAEL